jgi:hypothetical protein
MSFGRFRQGVDPVQQPAAVIDESFGPDVWGARDQVINEINGLHIPRMSLGRHREEFLAQRFNVREVQISRSVFDLAWVLERR